MDAIKRVEASVGVPDISRELGISTATFYKWRVKYGSIDVSMILRMKELEKMNRRLQKNYLEENFKAEIVLEALEKKVVWVSRRIEMAKKAVTNRGDCNDLQKVIIRNEVPLCCVGQLSKIVLRANWLL